MSQRPPHPVAFPGPPRPIALERVERGFERWRKLAETAPAELADFIRASAAAADSPGQGRPAAFAQCLPGIFSGSTYLTECLLAEPGLARAFAERGPDELKAEILGEFERIDRVDRHRLMAQLRLLKRRAALLTALADLTGAWELEAVTGFLSAIADRAVDRAVDHLLDEGCKRGDLEPGAEGPPPGMIILGMGKLGADELNYSSDIDLIVLFDEQRLPYRGAEAPMAFAVRFTRALVHILEHKTREGYVFRTDLRLRPHLPGHPLAISTEAAELYYERHGQNWERAAFIKARPVAGDLAAGRTFLATLRPYVWRKHLDFAAIRDIHSIKRQINAHRGFASIRLFGHDLKVGRGGIREIEFFVQTQQLILGGRHAELRDPRTCKALQALAAGRWIDEAAGEELASAYRRLRALEHRLQMQNDKQTQALPTLEDDFRRFAGFAGSTDPEAFGRAILGLLRTVEGHYAALFETEPDLGLEGSLVFTGTEDDPATLLTLQQLGFSNPSAVSQRIRDWHHGHIRATRSTRARELLTELLPGILDALHRQRRIDEAFQLFDEFLTSLPAGVQIFSLFRANPRLVGLLADLVGAAPRLASRLARQVSLFEAMLQPDFFDPLPEKAALRVELERQLGDARDLEDTLDLCRRWAQGRQFQAGLQVLLGVTDASSAAAMLTDLAEVVLDMLLPVAVAWLEHQHGRIPGGRFCVLGLGKFGARELTIGSDLDLVFLYEAPQGASSDGARPLDPATWYARLGQRLVSALSARTAEGQLFEIDMRLRPSGNIGPVATSIANFARYHEMTAETWEQQALCRARVITGDQALMVEVETIMTRAIARPRDQAALERQVRSMRERIFKEHGKADPFELKHTRGGLVDLEFAAQYLQLAHAQAHPELRRPGTRQVLERAGLLGLIAAARATELIESLLLQQALQMVLRLSRTTRPSQEGYPKGLEEALVRAAGRALPHAPPLTTFGALEQRLVESQAVARRFFDELCPAEGADGRS